MYGTPLNLLHLLYVLVALANEPRTVLNAGLVVNKPKASKARAKCPLKPEGFLEAQRG